MSIKLLIHFDQDYKDLLSEDDIKTLLNNRLEEIEYVEVYDILETKPDLEVQKAILNIEKHDLSLNSNNLSSKLNQDLGFSHKVQVLDH